MITVIFTIKNRARHLAENCINSLINQDCRIIVVDYGSDDLSWYSEVFKTGYIAVKRDTEVFRKGRAYNIGLRLVTTPYVVFSDIDNIFKPNFIERVKKEIVKGKTVVLCKCEDLDKDGKVYRLHPKTGYGACFGVDTQWIKNVNGYDEFYTYWGREDDDMVRRAKRHEYNIVWLEPLIQHQWHEKALKPTLTDNTVRLNTKRPVILDQLYGQI
jgi:glycosyltransferase involved in cell wall biosynthesis